MIARLVAALAAVFLCVGTAHAHQTSQSWLRVMPSDDGSGAVQLQWDIALRDLDMVLNLDSNLDGALSRREVEAGNAGIEALARSSLIVSVADDVCVWRRTERQIVRRNAAAQARLQVALDCPAGARAMTIDYRLFRDLDASHRGLLTVGDRQWLLAPDGDVVTVPVADDVHVTGAAVSSSWLGFVGSGIHHILIGWDHLAFLLALLIPVWLMPSWRERAGGVSDRRALVRALLLTITAFTVAHSLTLALAATRWVSIPSAVVEAIIAATIVITAAANLMGQSWARGPGLAFAFGLVHGFGFANVMQAGEAGGAALLAGVFGFNLGVEIGQLLFVGLTLPLFWLLAQHARVRQHAATALSLMLVALGSGWFAERLFDVALLPGWAA